MFYILGPKKWTSLFYRALDSSDKDNDEDRKLEEIERDLFLSVKDKACDEEGNWDGSYSSNKKADGLIAKALHTSLKTYEVNKKEIDDTFFTF